MSLTGLIKNKLDQKHKIHLDLDQSKVSSEATLSECPKWNPSGWYRDRIIQYIVYHSLLLRVSILKSVYYTGGECEEGKQMRSWGPLASTV